MPKVISMHFVCRDDLNVTDFGNGTFETGVWAVSAQAAQNTRRVALQHPTYQNSIPHPPSASSHCPLTTA